MNEERDEDSGKFESKYTDEDFIVAIETLDGVAGTSEVAEEVGCPRRTAYNRLDQLRERGVLQTRDIGPSLLWTLLSDSQQSTDAEKMNDDAE